MIVPAQPPIVESQGGPQAEFNLPGDVSSLGAMRPRADNQFCGDFLASKGLASSGSSAGTTNLPAGDVIDRHVGIAINMSTTE